MRIEKMCKNRSVFKSDILYYESAREAMKDALKVYSLHQDITLFVPGYIGWSPNEGSGIFDPIQELELNTIFYKMDEGLYIDIADFKNKIKGTKGKKVILLVHYFGYLDKNYDEIIGVCKENECIVIEDLAHAFFTDYIGGIAGRKGDVAFYSLHKMFPFSNGGMLKINNPTIKIEDFIGSSNNNKETNLWEYDLKYIADKRCENAEYLSEIIKPYEHLFEALRPQNEQVKGTVPQTFPIKIKEGDRDNIYHELNSKGYGVVSLYHTMIEPLRTEEFSKSIDISRHILNLPVHQEVSKGDLQVLVKYLVEECEKGMVLSNEY